jgi:hypothetical protein
MNWSTAVYLWACGGLIVQAVTFSASIDAWQAARRQALTAHKRSALPRLSCYIDTPAEVLVLLTRFGLGALAGFLFHTQVTGVTAAIAVGASAPALLRQFGKARAIAGLDDREGTTATESASNLAADLDTSLVQDG